MQELHKVQSLVLYGFLIYIKDLLNKLSSNSRHFTDGTSLFLTAWDTNLSALNAPNDLLKINNWAYWWEMGFDPEAIFSCKTKKQRYPVLIFNNCELCKLHTKLDEKLRLGEHLRHGGSKVGTSIGLQRKLQKCLPRRSLVTIYDFALPLWVTTSSNHRSQHTKV